jgi:hypothetical protein
MAAPPDASDIFTAIGAAAGIMRAAAAKDQPPKWPVAAAKNIPRIGIGQA